MSKARRDSLTKRFALEIDAKSKAIDPTDEQDWYSLTLGWALGQDLSPADAHDFATYIRYETELG